MTIASFGNFGVSNIGDDLILMGLQKNCEQDHLIIFCGAPEKVREQFKLEAHEFFPGGLRSIFRSFFHKSDSVQALQKTDLIVIGGGGILVDRSFKAVFLWWRQLKAIAKSGKPFEFWSNSFELRHWWSRCILVPYLRRARKITVRDRASKMFVESVGIKAEIVQDLGLLAVKGGALALLAPSYAWSQNGHDGSMPSMEPAKELKTLGQRKKVCFALCKWGLSKEHLKILRLFIEHQRESGTEVVGLAFQTVGDDDRETLQKLDIPIKSGLQSILAELSTSDLLIGMRLHSLILAHHLKVPVIAIAYQDKVKHFMEDQELSDRLLSLQDLTESSSLEAMVEYS